MRALYAGICIAGMALFIGGMKYLQTGIGEGFGFGFSFGLLLGIGMTIVAMSIERRESRSVQRGE